MKRFYRQILVIFFVTFILTQSIYSQCGNNASHGVSYCSCEKCAEKAGDPLNPYTGNEHREVIDLQIWGGVGNHQLAWTRYYNSRGGFDRGELQIWSHSYQYNMADAGYNEQGQAQFIIIYPEGGYNFFTQSISDPSLWVTVHGVDIRLNNIGNNFFLQLANGYRYRFEKLVDVLGSFYYQFQDFQDTYKNLYRLSYNNKRELVKVTEPAGRFLQVEYDVIDGTSQVVKVSSHDGRSVKYKYNGHNIGPEKTSLLTYAEYGDGTKAMYTYVSPWAGLFLLEHSIDPRYAGNAGNMSFTYETIR